jgi:hypothetical protein
MWLILKKNFRKKERFFPKKRIIISEKGIGDFRKRISENRFPKKGKNVSKNKFPKKLLEISEKKYHPMKIKWWKSRDLC